MKDLAEEVLDRLMVYDVDGQIVAGRYERSEVRTTQRNGYRHRAFDTRLGTLDLKWKRRKKYWLGSMYCPMYILHMPIVFILTGLAARVFKVPVGEANIFLGIASAFIIVVCSHMTALMIDGPVQRFLSKRTIDLRRLAA